MAETKATQKKADADQNGHDETNNVTSINPTELGGLEPDPNYTPTYEIRKLHAGDAIKVFRWVRAASAEESIMNAAVNGGQSAAVQELIHVLLGTVEDEALPWLFEITGNEGAKPEELEFYAIPDMAADLANDRNFLKLFSSASRASHAIRRISSLFSTAPESQNGSGPQTTNS